MRAWEVASLVGKFVVAQSCDENKRQIYRGFVEFVIDHDIFNDVVVVHLDNKTYFDLDEKMGLEIALKP